MGIFSAVALAAVLAAAPAPMAAADPSPPRILLITAHPDDETLFNLGRFAERGSRMAVALVTNGEGGAVVQSIRPDYDPQRDPDVLVEAPPGPTAWLTTPPDGPRLRLITTPTALAAERRREFLSTMAEHRVERVYFLSTVRGHEFEDSWDNGVRNWDKPALRRELARIAKTFRPHIVVTLNPGETWAHPQHVGLGRLVRKWLDAGRFDTPRRPSLYGLREHAWYSESMAPQSGDLTFRRDRRSPVLRTTYEQYWRTATSAYLSQSSHPVWLDARAAVGILPGYRGVDVLRRLDGTRLFQSAPRDRQAYKALPRQPIVVRK
ncbi:MAG: PIG-L family deacetylase [Actinobacteria bacterium]|nr:PIG-L family deacetylase [Actinomycetota bacterium]